MNLSDLLVTYNQVKAPTEIVNQFLNQNLPNPNSSKFERFIEYLNTKKDKKPSNNSSTVKEDVGFPGWENSGAPPSNDSPKITETTTVSRSLNNKSNRFCDLDNFDFNKEWKLATSQESETVTKKLSDYQNSKELEQYKKDLAEFYKTPYGKKFDPNAKNIKNETREKTSNS